MIKGLLLGIVSFWVISCSAHDKNYYSVHPEVLQKALKQCPAKSPAQVSCDELQKIALRLNKLAFELRINPQQYGQQILSLQETIAEQTAHHNQESSLANTLEDNQRQLNERLAIVRWLESPES